MTVAANNPRPRNRVLIILLVVIAVLVAALVGGELYVRNQVKTCMADQFQSELGSQVDVGLSWKPVLLQAVDKRCRTSASTVTTLRSAPQRECRFTRR